MITSEAEVMVHSVNPGGVVVIIIHEDGGIHCPEQVIRNIKGSHNINTSVVYATTEDIMTISAIHCNIYFMPCSYKLGKILLNQVLNMTIKTKLINRLFRSGIPQSQLYNKGQMCFNTQ